MVAIVSALKKSGRNLVIGYSEICSYCVTANHLEFQKKGENFTTHIFECSIDIDAVIHGFSNAISRLTLEELLILYGCNRERAWCIAEVLEPFWRCPLYAKRRG